MKTFLVLVAFNAVGLQFLHGQDVKPNGQQRKDIAALIDQYSVARETGDTVLLKQILTTGIDQLVSNGEWRTGIQSAVQGMLRSSTNSPGTRTLRIERIRLLTSNCAVVDCAYQIGNPDGTSRKMWSAFLVVYARKAWKISAIRNMLPAK